MSFFPRFAQEFSPLLRIIDDCDLASRSVVRGLNSGLQSFQPKFDVKELKDAYELTGELPGIEQQNVSIEWTNGNTLSISGRTEKNTERSSPSKAAVAGESIAEIAVTAESSDDAADTGSESSYVKPSVTDESEDGENSTVAGETSALTPATTNAGEVKKPVEIAQPTAKYWVSERSVGKFHRSFSFPIRVDHEAVKASLKNGVLTIVVPKAKIPQPRKINIE